MKLSANERRALCGICPAGCWVILAYDAAGKIAAVRADEGSPFGITCRLGEHSPDIVYSDQRLLYPMRRKGSRGTYKFERITWEEAFHEIVKALNRLKNEFGPESTAIYTGRGSFELAMCDIFQPNGVAVSSASSVLFPFGSPNTMGVGALCYVSMAMIAPHVTMGGMFIDMFSDIEHAELIVVWGANPATDCPPLDLKRIMTAKQKGTKVVVIDPRRTMTAKLTDATWVPIRPGTDGALALGMCNVLIAEELYDESFVGEWTFGFEEFAQYVKHFSPELVASITGVPSETIISLAKDIVSANGASPIMYSGLEYSDCGVQAIRATMILWALSGQLDVPGGRCFSMRENNFPINREGLISNPDIKHAIGRDRFPVYSAYRGESHANALPESVLHGRPYPIKSLIILGGSIITSWPLPKVWRETLKGLEYLACIDVNLTADCAYADIVLPAATWYEIESYMIYGPIFRIREKIIEPLGESRNAFLILSELAHRLGYGHLYPQREEEILKHALKASSFSVEDVRAAGGQVQIDTVMMQYKKWEKGLLRADGKPGFETPTGKFEIASTILEEHGYDPLPAYTEPFEGPVAQPELAKKFPLILNTGSRVTTDFRSQFHGIPRLVKQRPEPTVTMNIKDAECRGIRHGNAVNVRSPRGKVKMRAVVNEDIMTGTVDANMGGGGPIGPKAWRDCNINDLTDLRYDPISGFPVYKALLCEIERASESIDRIRMDTGEKCGLPETPHVLTRATTIEERIYLDHNATTYLDPEVGILMKEYLETHQGNPSSIYYEGREARLAVEDARRKVADLIGSTARRIVFTGGGSESNNLVIKGMAFKAWNSKKHIITSSIEHPSVLNICEWLKKFGFKITMLPVDRYGILDPSELSKAMDDKTFLVSVMLANNETGSIQPVKDMVRIAHKFGVPFHTDAVQAVGKIHFDIEDLGADFLTLSGHKLYGPKGMGAMFIRKGMNVESLIHGGSQEGGMRAGTENLAGIAGLGKAAELAERRLKDLNTRVKILRDKLWKGISQLIPDAKLNGHMEHRLPNTLNVSLPGIRGESMVLALDQKGICLSSASACRSGSPNPSHALLAMGLSEEEAHCALRFSLGVINTQEHVDKTLKSLGRVLQEAMHMVRFSPCR